jgi:hypothetical protein
VSIAGEIPAPLVDGGTTSPDPSDDGDAPRPPLESTASPTNGSGAGRWPKVSHPIPAAVSTAYVNRSVDSLRDGIAPATVSVYWRNLRPFFSWWAKETGQPQHSATSSGPRRVRRRPHVLGRVKDNGDGAPPRRLGRGTAGPGGPSTAWVGRQAVSMSVLLRCAATTEGIAAPTPALIGQESLG